MDDVRSLLFVALGELPMQQEFGTSVHAFVFENPTPIVQALVAQELRTIIATHVPEMKVLSVEMSVDGTGGPGRAIIAKVIYTIAGEQGEIPIPIGG